MKNEGQGADALAHAEHKLRLRDLAEQVADAYLNFEEANDHVRSLKRALPELPAAWKDRTSRDLRVAVIEQARAAGELKRLAQEYREAKKKMCR